MSWKDVVNQRRESEIQKIMENLQKNIYIYLQQFGNPSLKNLAPIYFFRFYNVILILSKRFSIFQIFIRFRRIAKRSTNIKNI
jgi:hypothetical protein